MSVEVQTVEFERREALLSELEEGPPFTVHGVALGSDDVTVGQSGVKKLWPAEELKEAADSLEGRNLVEDHDNSSRGVVGEVTKAGFKEGVGVIYEAELDDEELARKIDNGRLEVSIRGKHKSVDEMSETDDGAKVVEDIVFDNLSIVPTGAAPSNTIEMGEAEELSMAELAAFTEALEPEIEPGMWVKWGENRGITIGPVEDGEVEVDIYEKQDDQWRSIEETTAVSTDDLSKWDVDEEDIGPAQDDDEEEDEEEDDEQQDEEENAVTTGDAPSQDAQPSHDPDLAQVPSKLRFDDREDAEAVVEENDELTGVHEMEGMWIPGTDHEEFLSWRETQGMASMASEGDKVKWSSSGGQAMGVVVERKTDGCFSERIDGDQEICSDEDDPVVLIEIVDDGERTGTMVAHKESTVSSADFEMSKHKMDPETDDEKESEAVDPPEFSEGMMVQWQVNPNMFGEVVHNPDDRNIVMVEVMERMDGEMKPTGHTLTAAPPDLQPLDREQMTAVENLESFSDYPEAAKENAQMALDAREETDNPNDCGTEVGWRRANQLASGEAVSEEVVAKMSSFNRHRQNSDMDDEEGKADCGWMMWKAWGGDEGVDWAMRKQDEIEEMSSIRKEGEEKPLDSKHDLKDSREDQPEKWLDSEVEELQDLEVHSVDFSGTTESSWDEPALEDFDKDDLSEVAGHFLVSKTGFPPENFTDLALPVVEPNGDLNLNALQNAKARANQVENLSGDDLDRVESTINSLANDNFDDADFGDEEQAATHPEKRKRTVDDTGDEPSVEDVGPVDVALDLINKYLTVEGTHERDSVDDMLSWLLGSVDLPIETLDDFRMAARRFLDETAGSDSFDALTVEQFRDWLLMHGKGSKGRREQDQSDKMPRGGASSVNVLAGDDLQQRRKSGESELDEITTIDTTMTDEDIEEKLAELNEPVAVEQDDLEELQDKADRFEEMSDTLESLKERTDVLDDVDREKVEELAETDEPVVVESTRYDELTEEANQVKSIYAEALAEDSDVLDADELADRFSIEELHEKYEDQIGDPEELADSESAEPRSGDADEEELEDESEEDSTDEQVEEMQAELREKILSDD